MHMPFPVFWTTVPRYVIKVCIQAIGKYLYQCALNYSLCVLASSKVIREVLEILTEKLPFNR